MSLPDDLRAQLIADPALILRDLDLMRALTLAREDEAGGNVIDIRGRAMEALETRLDRLETAHETVISAAWDNQSGAQIIHRAVVSLLEPIDFAEFVENLESGVAPVLRVESLRLLMEAPDAPATAMGGPVMTVVEGTVARLLAAGQRGPRGDEIVLRSALAETRPYHGTPRAPIKSEALLPIDLGPDRLPSLLLIGATESSRFKSTDGTDLLRFFGQVFRLSLMRWLRE